jgi:hypothetical protein
MLLEVGRALVVAALGTLGHLVGVLQLIVRVPLLQVIRHEQANAADGRGGVVVRNVELHLRARQLLGAHRTRDGGGVARVLLQRLQRGELLVAARAPEVLVHQVLLQLRQVGKHLLAIVTTEFVAPPF